ncbi:hypothetical protein ABTL90_19480, partial [Acinetobacter baumannii]
SARETRTAKPFSRLFVPLPVGDISEAQTRVDGYDRLGDSQAACEPAAAKPHTSGQPRGFSFPRLAGRSINGSR